MKTKISKILGVVLTVVLLSSLLVFAAPASAGTLLWTALPIPSLVNNQLVAANWSVGAVAVGPDGTLYAAVNDIQTGGATRPQVYRSVNGGYAWIPSASVLGATNADIIVDLEVANNGDIVIATADTTAPGAANGFVYRSQNGGITFSQLGNVPLVANEVITCVAIAPTYDGQGEIAIGVADVRPGVGATVGFDVYVWGFLGTLAWTTLGDSSGAATAEDIVALQYSPSYGNDGTLLAVAALTAADPLLRHWNQTGWNPVTLPAVAVGPAALTTIDYDGLVAAIATNMWAADIAVPSNYASTSNPFRRVYVSLVSEVAADCAIYRIDAVTPGVVVSPATLPAGSCLWDLDYVGTVAEGTLIGGLYDLAGGGLQLDVWWSTTVMPPWAVNVWYPATNAPTGVTILAECPTAGVPAGLNFLAGARVLMADATTIYVGTSGDDSAFGVSVTAGDLYNERGLIDNGGVAINLVAGCDIAIAIGDPNTMFMISDNSSAAASDTNVWRTTTGGASWDRVFTANFTGVAGAGIIAISEAYGADSTVYVADDLTLAFWYSNSGGEGWQLRGVSAATAVTQIVDMYANGQTAYVADGASGLVAKSLTGGWTWPLALVAATGSAGTLIDIAVDGEIVVVGDSQSCVYRSEAGGTLASWLQVGIAIAAAASTWVDVSGDQVYATRAGTGGIYRWDMGVSSSWYNLGDALTVAPGGGIVISDDNSLYVLDTSGAVVNNVRRTIQPTWGPVAPAPTVEWVTMVAAATATAMGIGSGGGSNTIVITDTAAAPDAVWIFTDTLSAGSTPPTLLAPADEYVMPVANADNFSVQNEVGVLQWNLWFSNDPNFINNVSVATVQTPPATLVTVNLGVGGLALNTELPVYWMARANVGFPLCGPFSAPRVVYPQPTLAPNAPAALNVNLNADGLAPVLAVFSWSAFRFATDYEIQIASAGTGFDFGVAFTDTTGGSTSYVVDTALDYDTAYSFRVRALTATSTSDWSASFGFRTEKAPVGVFTCPYDGLTFDTREALEAHLAAEHAPTTPLYIWIVIGIGALLVIAVIWLIFTTRKA